MELLESRAVRPRQARYQAALRPDIVYTFDSTVRFGFISTRDNRGRSRAAARDFGEVGWIPWLQMLAITVIRKELKKLHPPSSAQTLTQ